MEADILENILDGREKPTNLPFALLKNITENFSDDRVIGQGGFATVYEGVLPNGRVAVKRISNNHSIDEKPFYREVDSLLTTNHQNVVRFLGFCANTEQIAIKIEGSRHNIYAERRERLLCFEYMSNGSLQKHITDELRGFEWNIRYQIIKGICEGLHHLHKEKHIYHMDLKPANILLDNFMRPKITDFGQSRLDEKSQTMSEDRCGSLGYCAPEYLCSGKMSFKSDMFSLGVIMTELLTGGKGIPDNNKNNLTTDISVEDVSREVKILKALSGHTNLVKFYDACEDALNVYIIMELCEGGELLDRILARGGMYTEEDAKATVVQILSVVAFCHLQGVVHRDLKPENFLFTTRDDNASMKLIDFGLSDFVRPDERLIDIIGSAYYVAPEVLHKSYSIEADIWSIGVITYILLSGSRPFWARTESGIFRSVLRADLNLDDSPWPSVSAEAKDFVKRFLNKDHRKRMTAVQALTHPWLRDDQRQIPLDILIYRLIKQYLCATPLKRLALKALSKALKDDELLYLRLQLSLLSLEMES